jgi:nicotinate-nucleotide--dimethylbenzimidazole phosphoribosyltransferase
MHLQPSWSIRAVRAAALAGASVVSIAAAMTAPAGALEIYVANPFDDIRQLVQGLPEAKPAPAGPSDLGRLGAIASWMAGWQGKVKASADRPRIAIFAASHGLAERPGSDARAATRQALDAFAAGTAPINAICAANGLGFKALDLAVDLPSGDIAHEPAMDERACVATMAFGMESIAGGTDLIGIGEASPAAEIAAAAMLSALYGDPPNAWLDQGRCGPDAQGVVTSALLRHGRAGGDPLGVLASLGGRDLAAMAGAILASRMERVPVILDGFTATAAAAILHAIDPGTIGHCLPGHLSAHTRHGALLARLGLEPLLVGLGIGAGQGIGAALAAGLVKNAVAVQRDTVPAA